MRSKNFKAQAMGEKLLPVVFEEQVLPGSFAHALVYLLERVYPYDTGRRGDPGTEAP